MWDAAKSFACSFCSCRVFVKQSRQSWKDKLVHQLKNLWNNYRRNLAECCVMINVYKPENLEYTNSQPQAHGSTEVGEKIAEVKLQIARCSHLNLGYNIKFITR